MLGAGEREQAVWKQEKGKSTGRNAQDSQTPFLWIYGFKVPRTMLCTCAAEALELQAVPRQPCMRMRVSVRQDQVTPQRERQITCRFAD